MQILRTTRELADQYRQWRNEQTQEQTGETISVDEVAAQVASFYERIRGVVDWREEHLLRKTAIERMLRRRLMTARPGALPRDIALPLLQELTRGGHFPNNTIPVSATGAVQRAIDKYAFLAERARNGKERRNTTDWLFQIAASEIEEVLAPPRRERALMDFMTDRVREGLSVKGGERWKLTDEEAFVQVAIAVRRALFNLDEATITLHLLDEIYPDWRNPSPATLEDLARNLSDLQKRIRRHLEHPLAERFYRLAERRDAPFLLLGDVMTSYADRFPSVAEEDASTIETRARASYHERLLRLRARIRRAAIYSTISIFLTKILFVIALEIPLETYLDGSVNMTALGLSVAVPALFMFIIASSVRLTTAENEQRVILQMMRHIYAGQQSESYILRLPRRRVTFLSLFVSAFYLASFALSFGLIAWGLHALSFGFSSIAVFLLFLSLVAFAGTKIRQRGGELLVVDPPYSILEAVFDLFALPLVRVGKWLSRQISRYNILILLLNFLIDIPFQVFVEFLEQWRALLKEKRDEIH